jgi:hypothetical protein
MNDHDFKIHSIKNSLVLDKSSRSQEKFQLDINSILAKNYIDNLSEEVKKGKLVSASHGNTTFPAPYGYRNNKNTKLVEVVEHEAAMVKQAFRDFLAGVPAPDICRSTGIARSSIFRYLKNKYYAGKIIANGIEHQGKHPAIISELDYLRVQEKIKSKRNNKTNTCRHFRFSGLVRCSCGRVMVGDLKKRTYVYYKCSQVFDRKTEKSVCLNTRYLPEREVIEFYLNSLSAIKIDDKALAELKVYIDEFLGNAEYSGKQRLLEIQNKKTALETRIRKAKDLFIDGKLSDQDYQESTGRYKNEYAELVNQEVAIQNVNMDVHLEAYSWITFFNNMGKCMYAIEEPDYFNEMAKVLTRNLIYNGSALTVNWSSLIESLQQVILVSRNTHNAQKFESTWNHFITLFQIDIIKKEKAA